MRPISAVNASDWIELSVRNNSHIRENNGQQWIKELAMFDCTIAIIYAQNATIALRCVQLNDHMWFCVRVCVLSFSLSISFTFDSNIK